MNHLAHIYLSRPEPEALLGNLVADGIKGRDRLDALPEKVRAGVLFHREIDGFTDTHPVAREAAELFRPRWGRHSPILIDVFFDHCLARAWDRYESQPLPQFLADRYQRLRRAAPLLEPPECLRVFHLIARDLPGSYCRIEGIRAALGRISARAIRGNPDLRPAAEDFVAHIETMDELFSNFFPEAVRFARDGNRA